MNPAQHIPLSQDAALVVTLAGTAMSFAHSAEDEAERWLRAMRLHGKVGAALQALGVGEAPLMTGYGQSDGTLRRPPLGPDGVERISDRASEFASARGAPAVGTVDVLFALFESYGQLFDRALYLRGTSREELVERLTAAERPVADEA